MLRRLRRGVRLPGAGDRRGARASASAAASGWSATPTSSSPATTPPSACPRSTAARSARPPTWPGSCPSTRCGRWSTPAATATAAELHAFGSVLRGRAARRAARRRVRGRRARSPQKSPTVIRAAKETLNGIDLWDVKRSLPVRAGLHVRAQPLRRRRRAARRVRRQARRRHVQVTSRQWEQRDRQAHDRGRGRRRAARRHDDRHRRLGVAAQADEPRARDRCAPTLSDLTVVSYGGPDVGLLCAHRQGAARSSTRSCSLDSIALEPHFRDARQAGTVSTLELDEGMFLLGLQAAAWRVPFLPTRVGLGSDVVARQPEICARSRSPYDDGEELVAMPALHLDVALVHMNRGDQRGNGQYLERRPLLRRPHAAWPRRRRFMSVEQIVDTEDLASERPVADAAHQPADDRRRGRGAERRALHRVRARLRPRRGVPEGVRRRARRTPRRGRRGRRSTSTAATEAEYRKVVGL